MQGFLKPYQVEQIKKKYPIGTRIELDGMDNERDMPVGLKGTVQYVDDAGHNGKIFVMASSIKSPPFCHKNTSFSFS